MKNRNKVICLVLAVVLAVTVAVSASNSNAVVSLSYLTGTFWQMLTGRMAEQTKAMDQVYASAVGTLEEKLGREEGSLDWTLTSTFCSLYPLAGETVTLGVGSGCVWNSGTGAASALLVDVTTGEELAAGQPLTAGHRYLAEQETVITAISDASCAAEGAWRTTATGKAPVALPFTDVKEGSWYYSAVAYVVERGLFNGVTPTTFEPQTYMNRGMLVTVLHRLAGKPDVAGSMSFADVKTSDWYAPGVAWASSIGVVNGVTGTQFSPTGTVTREQIATILYRYSAYLGYDVSARASLSGFHDQNKISAYALETMSWAVAEGLMQGGDGKLDPTGGATRAQVATLLQRYAAWLEMH